MDKESGLIVYATGGCGLAAPIAMIVVVIVASLLAGSFDPATQFVSDLGTGSGPAASVMNVLGFGLVGILIIILAVGLYLGISAPMATRLFLSAVVVIAGTAILLLAAFPSDVQGDLNSTLVRIAGIALGLAPLLGALVYVRDYRWKRLWAPSLIAAIAALAFFSVAYLHLLSGYDGLFQNLNLAAGLLWIGISGLWMMRWN